jgi:hypothetical protein
MENKIESLAKRAAERSLSKEIHLPSWPDNKRGTPNTFLRSALFSAIQSKNRTDMKDVVLASQSNIVIRYSGEQLNQEDLSLWETLVHLAKDSPLENICEFSCYEILKSMSLGSGALDYARLDDGIRRLSKAHIDINNGLYFGTMIFQGSKDGVNGRYKLQLNKLLINLYQQSTWVDWDERLLLRKKPLAQFLHGYFSSHKKPYPVTVAKLMQLSGSKTKRIAKFKENLKAALDELVKIGFLVNYGIEGDLISVARK